MGCFDTASGTKQQSTSYLPSQAEALDKAISLYTPTLGQGANIYQGERVAGLTPSQQSVFDFAEGGGFMTSPDQTEEYFQNVIKAPAMKSLQEDVLPAVKEAYSGPGYWGSARASEEARTTENTVADLNTARNQLSWDVNQANKTGAIQQLEVGSLEQQQRQNEIDAEIQRFAEENAITDPQNLQILMALLGQSMSSSSGSTDAAGMGWGALAGALGALG
ncbi:MAG: hypothetical protein D4R45_01300 [Planctomycetaceae bacterium]|nr:MAG: hypothetical protein D4R45_01300 [Planctomycetaceae bacterium]